VQCETHPFDRGRKTSCDIRLPVRQNAGMPPRRAPDVRPVATGPRWFRFVYYLSPKGNRPLGPHQLRDGDAALFLAPVLERLGYVYGGPIFNYPNVGRPGALVHVDESELNLRQEDLLVLTTRPPLDDDKAVTKTRVLRSYTTLEEKLLMQGLRPHLSICSREQLVVANTYAEASPLVANRHNLQFRLYDRGQQSGQDAPGGAGSRAAIKRCVPDSKATRPWKDSKLTTSAVYMIYQKQGWPGGPGFLAAFGMGGTETLAWAYLLSTRFPHLVGARPFVMAEVVERALPDRPLNMDFADKWDVRPLTGFDPNPGSA
jgi:hypothetical protein